MFAIGGLAVRPRRLAYCGVFTSDNYDVFDAVKPNAIAPKYTAYLTLPAPPFGASPEAAAAAAAHGVLVRLFPAQQPALDATLAASLASVPGGLAKSDGIEYGDLVARTIYEARFADRMLASGPIFVNGAQPGEYQLTTPGPPQPVNTGAAAWAPFALTSASQFRPNGPARLSSPQYARDFNEVWLYGSAVGGARTPDQDQIARWHTEQGQVQFNRIARAEAAIDGRSLIEPARLFALLNIALADATTAVFEAKYFFRFWRPSTAIRNAHADDNAMTAADPAWSPFLTTPPHPEYPAAHGAVQAAGARVMKDYFGPNYAFTTTAPPVPGVTRSYDDFDAYIAEGREARILGGMHFRSSLDEGAKQGISVGNWVIDHCLLPL